MPTNIVPGVEFSGDPLLQGCLFSYLDAQKIASEHFADHFRQARMFYHSQRQVEQTHIVEALVFELSKVTLDHVRARVAGQLRNSDEAMAAKVTDGLAIDLPTTVAAARAPFALRMRK